MRYLAFLLLVLFSAALPAVSTQSHQALNTAGIIRLVESHYGHMNGLAAMFVQTYTAPGTFPKSERGQVFLRRPHQMRWEYESKKLFVVNEREAWFYVPDDREATVVDAGKINDPRLPLMFLLGTQNLSQGFRSIELMTSDPSSGTYLLHLIPKRTNLGLKQIFIWCDESGKIGRIRLDDNFGAISEIALENVRENFVAPASAFSFNPPPGVQIRRQN